MAKIVGCLDVTGAQERPHGRPRAAAGDHRPRPRGLRAREPAEARGALRLEGAPRLGRRRAGRDPREPDRRGRRRPAVAGRPARAGRRRSVRDHDGLRPVPAHGRAARRACAPSWTASAACWRESSRAARSRSATRSSCSSGVPEAPLEETEYGLVPKGKGWFVLNAREAPWMEPRGPWRGQHGSRATSRARPISRSSGSTSACSGPASRCRCTTGRPTRRTSSSSPARRWRSSRARSGRCVRGTSSTARPARTT